MLRLASVLAVLALASCKGSSTAPDPVVETTPADPVISVTVDASAPPAADAALATLPEPPNAEEPLPGIDWVAQLSFDPPIAAGTLVEANADLRGDRSRYIWVHDAKGWTLFDNGVRGAFDRVAVVSYVLGDRELATAATLDSDIAFARRLFARIAPARTPDVPFALPQLVAAARAHLAFAEQVGGVAMLPRARIRIVAPAGGSLAVSAIRKAASDAGMWAANAVTFKLGARSSSQQITMTSDVPLTDDASRPATHLLLSFDIPTAYRPEEVFEIMLRAASAIATRIGGELHDDDTYRPFDATAARAQLAGWVKRFRDHGIEPGTPLARRLF